MALTRSMLKAMGIEADKIDEIIEAHTDVTNALKDQADAYKADADKLAKVQKELDTLKANASTDDWEEKFNAEHKAFEEFKADITAKETKNAKEKAYKQILADSGISEKAIPNILRVADLSKIKLDKDGNIADKDEIAKAVKDEWGGFITSTETSGAKTVTPPSNGGGSTMTKEEIMAIKDASKRQRLIAENHELFGI